MSEILTRDVPTHYLFLLFVSGFMLLLLCPISLFPTIFPEWINPLSQQTGVDAAASVGLLTLYAFIMGLPSLVLRDYITGRYNWITTIKKAYFKKYFKIAECPDVNQQQLIYFQEKMEKYPAIGKMVAFLSIRFQVITGIIIACEIAFAVNVIIATGIILTTQELSGQLALVTQRMCFSIIIWVFAWGYDKKFKKIFEVSDAAIQKRLEKLDHY